MCVDQYDDVIETRRKVYRLALDLQLSLNVATLLSTSVSELLNCVLGIQKSTQVIFAFTQQYRCYQLHILISSTKETYQQLKTRVIFNTIGYCLLDRQNFCIEIVQPISSQSFIPDDNFLKTEKERLIQQSSGEMLREIRKKNAELAKALHDLNISSEMIQREKMSSLGIMTAGVAHELNNPLMAILIFIQYAIKHTNKEDRRYQPLVDAEREVVRCQEIIINLLTFSRMEMEGEEAFSPIKISELFERVLLLQAYKLRTHSIRIVKQYPNNEPSPKMKINKIQQVILNLIANAIDAMNGSVKKELTLSIQANKQSVTWVVSDTGSGINEKNLGKIFDPFFTTKPPGEGTGLGLSISKSIIDEHNGTMTCNSIVGEGTRFIISQPIH